MKSRTHQETVMLGALETVLSSRHSDGCPALWGSVCGGMDGDVCALFLATRALAIVKALDDAETKQARP